MNVESTPWSLERLKNRLAFSCRKYGVIEELDDIFQEFFVHGRHGQTIDQFVIDHLRRSRGDSRTAGHAKRHKLNTAEPIETVEYSLSSDRSFELDMGSSRDFWRHIKGLNFVRDREIAMLYFWWGYRAIEIGNFYKVSESRISQILERIQECLSTRASKKSGASEKGMRRLAKVGEIEIQEISLGTPTSLAFKKPREVASLNEEGFEEWLT